jgi:hypothetical protein
MSEIKEENHPDSFQDLRYCPMCGVRVLTKGTMNYEEHGSCLIAGRARRLFTDIQGWEAACLENGKRLATYFIETRKPLPISNLTLPEIIHGKPEVVLGNGAIASSGT